MATRTRRRHKTFDRTYTNKYYQFGNLVYQDNISGTFAKSRHVTVDEVHDWPASKGKTGRDLGGPFVSTKATLKASWDLDRDYTLGRNQGGFDWVYNGYVFPSDPLMDNLVKLDEFNFLYREDVGHMDLYLQGKGATAISKTIPTNAPMDVSVSLAELYREGVPALLGVSLFKERAAFFRNLGGEYLNYEFGWKPFVSDILSLADTVIESEKMLSQLARDSGKNVRRRVSFPAERSTEYGRDNITFDPPLGGDQLQQRGRDRLYKSYDRSWFSGCYTYHYDPSDLSEASRIATQARLLYGLKIDPEVLWNLAPWSWLVDWFVNIGPVLHNLSAFGQDGLVLRYGYLMHHSMRTVDLTNVGVTLPRGGTLPTGDLRSRITWESKRRIRATPFGFGTTLSSLSARQWAILGALGMTRGPSSL